MNTALPTTLGRHKHPPGPPVETTVQGVRVQHVRRVGLLDRAALRLGLALIVWGRRPLTVASREQRARRAQQHSARLERERAAERLYRLNVPRL